MGLANCRGTLLLAHPTWLMPASSQVSANLRRLGDSESNTPRPQCGREPPPHLPRSGSQVSAAKDPEGGGPDTPSPFTAKGN